MYISTECCWQHVVESVDCILYVSASHTKTHFACLMLAADALA